MATTTNYGWTTPDDTALVKDGAAAIRSLGTSIDTTTKNLNPSTTLGDIEYRSSTANTNTRLGIGTTGQVLVVSGGVPAWGSPTKGQLTEVAFTSSNASWTIPTGVTGIWALVVGGGGGGGASAGATASNSSGGGGAGRVLETFFTVAGDTTLNITVGAGGTAGTAGGKGGTGGTSSIVGNTSATTYASATGGGGGGGGAAANVTGNSGASGGGTGTSTAAASGSGGGGYGESAASDAYGLLSGTLSGSIIGGGVAPTTPGVTGTFGGSQTSSPKAQSGGKGIFIWNRALAAGGTAAGTGFGSNQISSSFGAAAAVANDAAASAATANSGSGGIGVSTSTSTARAGGAGGSGLVVLRYVV